MILNIKVFPKINNIYEIVNKQKPAFYLKNAGFGVKLK